MLDMHNQHDKSHVYAFHLQLGTGLERHRECEWLRCDELLITELKRYRSAQARVRHVALIRMNVEGAFVFLCDRPGLFLDIYLFIAL